MKMTIDDEIATMKDHYTVAEISKEVLIQFKINALKKVVGVRVAKRKNFEDFLQEEHADDYIGTKDSMVDDYSEWLEKLGIDEWVEFGDKFANTIRKGVYGGGNDQ